MVDIVFGYDDDSNMDDRILSFIIHIFLNTRLGLVKFNFYQPLDTFIHEQLVESKTYNI